VTLPLEFYIVSILKFPLFIFKILLFINFDFYFFFNRG
jgi:hypothetical protein